MYWYVWKQCAGLKYRKVLPVTLGATFLFISIYYKSISNPLVTYLAIGLVAFPAIVYGLMYQYEILLIIAAIYIPHNQILPASFGGVQRALNGTNIILVALSLNMIGRSLKGEISRGKNLAPILVWIFIVMVALSFIRGMMYHGSIYAQGMIFGFKQFITPMVLFLIFAYTIRDRQTIKILVSIFMIVIVMALFLGILEWVDLGFATYSGFKRRLGGLNMQPNHFAAFISYYICLMLGQFLVNFRKAEAKFLIFPFLIGLRVMIPTNTR